MKLGTHRPGLLVSTLTVGFLCCGSLIASDAATAATSATLGAAVAPLQYSFGAWPPDLSTHGAEIQGLYDMIFWITGATFLITEGLLLWFLFKYRHREGHRAVYYHGNTALEIAWTLIPVVVFVAMGLTSADVFLRQKDPRKFPAESESFQVKVTGKQFEWLVRYPGVDGKFDTEDDLTTINDLHVPVGKPVRVKLTALDVIHSFFLPELRVKQDAVPGMQTEIWFQATRAAQTEIACAELCGLGHYRMRGKLTIEPLKQVEEWIAREKADE